MSILYNNDSVIQLYVTFNIVMFDQKVIKNCFFYIIIMMYTYIIYIISVLGYCGILSRYIINNYIYSNYTIYMIRLIFSFFYAH